VAGIVLLLGAPAASAGVVVHGRSWLGGHGVDVCYPAGGGCAGNASVGTPRQCVELAQRLYNHLGWWGGIFGGVRVASQIYGWAPSHGMSVHRNGSGYIPVPGDMIVSAGSPAVSAGHVAVVDTVDLDRHVVHAVEQNADPSGRSTYRLRGSTLSRPGAYGNILGVVHSPRDHFNAYGWDGRFHDGSIYRDGLHGRLYLVAGGARIALNGARKALGYGRAPIQPVPRGRIPRLPAIPREGTLLQAPGVQGLWLIHRRRRFHVLKRGHHRLFAVTAASLASIPVGTRW
jgi:hypothetical protein